MNLNVNEYVNKRMEELTEYKSAILQSLTDMNKTGGELSLEAEKEIIENKMKYYSAAGALAELEGLKKVLNIK